MARKLPHQNFMLLAMTPALLASASGTAMAQAEAPVESVTEDTTRSGSQVEDIIVTARRTDENLQDVPVFVSQYSADVLADKGITSVEDLAQIAPNLYSVSNGGTANGLGLTVRGQGQRDNLLTLDPSVGVYVDDVYYARSYEVPATLLDVASVEVLNGPQGTLYGRNSTGGAIKITTQKPDTDEVGGYVRASYGNYDAIAATGAINIPIVPDLLAVRYAAEYRKRDGYTNSFLVPTIISGVPNAAGVATSLTPIRQIDTDNEDSFAQRLSLRFTPSDDLTFDIAGFMYRARDNGVAIFTPFGDIQNFNPTATTASFSIFSNSPQRASSFYSGLTGVVPYSKVDVKSVNGAVDWRASDAFGVELIVAYVDARNRNLTNFSGVVNGSLQYLNPQVVVDQSQHQLSEELKLSGTVFNDSLDYVLGLYNFYETGNEDPSGTRVIAFNNDISNNPQFSANNLSRSAFGNLIYRIGDRLRVNGGLRYNVDRKRIDASPRFSGNPTAFQPGDTGAIIGLPGICVLSAATPGAVTSTTNGGPCSIKNSSTFKYFTWEVGADYQIADDILAYAKISRGVRSGGQNARLVTEQVPSSFAPEKVTNYEAGFKSDLFDRRLRLNASFFHNTLSNAQQSVIQFIGGRPTNIIINSGGAKINGFEVQAVLAATDNLRLSAGAGYNDFDFDTPGQVQPYNPDLTYNLSATYTQPTSFGEVKADLNYYYVSSVFIDVVDTTPQSTLPGYGLLDARLGITLKNDLKISIFGKNLLEKEYFRGGLIAGADPVGLGGPPFVGERGTTVGAPRTYGVEVEFKF